MAPTPDGNPKSDIPALLLELLNPLSTSETLAAALGGFPSGDWQNFSQYLETHSLANLLYTRLQQNELLDLVPADERRALRENYLANAARNLLLLTRAAQSAAPALAPPAVLPGGGAVQIGAGN